MGQEREGPQLQNPTAPRATQPARARFVRSGKSLEATDEGIRLIEIVHAEFKSPAMTGQWEAYLKGIQRGNAALEPFLKDIEDYVREVVGKVGNQYG